ncbi:alpha-ribazole phosphatase [Alkalitalea saponilacus]|uniref:Alpha-ribazole phosphatase n=1 Tax=Alkalitalea saponilacus TaxID=889453 RepID=A0A1T5BUR4_9BACT|nr:alpha-ribazole phosphatase [Alkalitalea saponilacus]ASB49588.1 alpha-ribazole phosphatase [Alkalitalea saponilacus]SKB50926.1 alpha-ribazole phosphatase [Alkalitalea saponilacus]
MQLTLIRHIKTFAPEGLCYGQTDIGLPPGYGKVHAGIAEKLKDSKFDVIFSSPLQRCKLLAEAISKNRQPIVCDDRLKELNFGEWEMKMWSDIESSAEAKLFFEDYINVAPPGGESFQEMIHRIKTFNQELRKNYTGKRVLIVSHGGPIRVFVGLNKNIEIQDIFDIRVDYGQLIKLMQRTGE